MSRKDADPVLRVKRADEEVRIVSPLADRVAEERLDLLAREDVGARLVEGVDIDDERQLLDQSPIAPLDLTSVAGLRRIGGLHMRAAVHSSSRFLIGRIEAAAVTPTGDSGLERAHER